MDKLFLFLKKKIVSQKKTLKKYFSIHADFRPMGYKLSPCGSRWLGFLFNFIVGHCGAAVSSGANR